MNVSGVWSRRWKLRGCSGWRHWGQDVVEELERVKNGDYWQASVRESVELSPVNESNEVKVR